MKTKQFKFYENRYKFLGFSAGFLLVGILCLFIFGAKLDIQFKGGSLITYSYEGELNLETVDEQLEKALSLPLSVQSNTSLVTGTEKTQTYLVVSIAGNEALSTEQSLLLTETLHTNYPAAKFELQNAQLVNPYIGQRTLINGLLAILVASVLIVLYVWFQFRSISGISAGVFSLLVLFHDVILAFFVFIMLQIPLNETLIAVVLSILGWSVNDTIVIFDRIRENERLHKNKMVFTDLVNLSINQSMTRSINTSLCAFMAVAVAYVFATLYNLQGIQEFALPMMVGILVGSYSSICIATPFWADWKIRGGRTGYEI